MVDLKNKPVDLRHELAVADYNAYREAGPTEPICYAPFLNMHFAPTGRAIACCYNGTYALGTYPQDSVDDIWNGEGARLLRQAIVNNDLTRGCNKCLQQLHARDFVGFYPESFRGAARKAGSSLLEELAADPLLPSGPRKLEFEAHNTCNLECVMCHGILSSKIRSNRDALPALPCPYDDAFVDQIAPYLPKVVEAGFAGGEPFLIKFYHQIWDRIPDDAKTLIMIVTNGTILTDRVRGVVERLNCVINVSMDSIVKETYETIRKNSSLDLVLKNSEYFADLMKRKGNPFIWRCCVMRQNWREIPDMVRYCDERDIQVIFNQVEYPLSFSLFTLSPTELQEVVTFLKRADNFDAKTPAQTFNHEQYRGLVKRLDALLGSDNFQNGLMYRLTVAKRISSPDDQSGAVYRYVATSLTINQALNENEDTSAPEIAQQTLSEVKAELNQQRSEMDTREFIWTFLNGAVRAYVNAWGVPPDHSPKIFDKVGQFTQLIAQHPECERIVDRLLLWAPDKLYQALATQEPSELQWSLVHGDIDPDVIGLAELNSQPDPAQLAEERRVYDENFSSAAAAYDQGDKTETSKLLADCHPAHRGWEWHRLDRLSGELPVVRVPVRRREQGSLLATADTSPTDFRVAIVDGDQKLSLCELKDGKTIWTRPTELPGWPLPVYAPTGDMVAVYTEPGNPSPRLEVWDTEGNQLWDISCEPENINSVTFSPDGRYLALSTVLAKGLFGKYSVELHDIANRKRVWKQKCKGAAMMTFDQESKHLFLTIASWGSFSSRLCRWSIEKPSVDWKVKRNVVAIPSVNSEGLVLVGGKDHTLEVRDPDSGKLLETLQSSATDIAAEVRCSPDGRHVLSSGNSGQVVLWDWGTKSEKLSIQRFGSVRPAFTSDSKHFAVGESSHLLLELRPVDRAPAEIVLTGHEQAVTGIAFAAQGKQLVSTSCDGSIRRWNAATGQQVECKNVDSAQNVLAHSPMGTHLATGGSKELSLWNVEDLQVIHRWSDVGSVDCLTFSPNGERLMAGGGEAGLKLLGVENNSEVLAFENVPPGLVDIVFSADGRGAISLSGQSGQIDLWDVDSASGPQPLRPAGQDDHAAALERIRPEQKIASDDSESKGRPANLVAAAVNNTIELWDVDAAEPWSILRGHDANVRCLTSNHDGSRLFSGDETGTIIVWNVDTGERLLTMKSTHGTDEDQGSGSQSVLALALSPDGQTLASAGADKLVKLWTTTHSS